MLERPDLLKEIVTRHGAGDTTIRQTAGTELDGLQIERDPDFPVRVTVQYYKATASGEVTAEDMDAIADDIERVYVDADYVGSLVTDGLTGRPTEYEGNHIQPDGWWSTFFARYRDVIRLAS